MRDVEVVDTKQNRKRIYVAETGSKVTLSAEENLGLETAFIAQFVVLCEPRRLDFHPNHLSLAVRI